MKKFMFSAVALIAFSFAGMANTGGEEKLELKEVVKIESIIIDVEVLKTLPCTAQWKADYEALMNYFDMTFAEANAIATLGFNLCLCNTYGACD